jgi:hypothetical protein
VADCSVPWTGQCAVECSVKHNVKAGQTRQVRFLLQLDPAVKQEAVKPTSSTF